MSNYTNHAADFFGNCFKNHGPVPQGVDWGGEEAQDLRLKNLLKIIPLNENKFSIADVGCGYGRLLTLLERANFSYYTGYEITDEFLNYTRSKFDSDPRVSFEKNTNFGDVSVHDYVILSGLFNKKFELSNTEFEMYIKDSLKVLSKRSKRGLAVNFLSSYSDLDKQRDDLYYTNPIVLFDFIKLNITPNVSLNHDYGLWDFNLFMRFS